MLYNIQFIRFIAAALVVAHHTFEAVNSKLSTNFIKNVENIFDFGAVGVHIFFVISGFIIVYTQRNAFGCAQIPKFLIRRFERIYPLYWVCAAFTIIVIFFLESYSLPSTMYEWLGAIALVPGQSHGIISVGWTLAYEIYFYLMFAGLLAMRLDMMRTLLLLSFTIIGLVSIGIFSIFDKTPFSEVIFSVLLLEFLSGAWIAYFVIKLGGDKGTVGTVIMLVGVFGFIFGLIGVYDQVPRIVLWGPPSVCIVFGLALMDKAQKGTRLARKFQELGDASYALYLIHPAILFIITFALVSNTFINVEVFVFLLIASLLINSYISLALNRYIQPRLRWNRKD